MLLRGAGVHRAGPRCWRGPLLLLGLLGVFCNFEDAYADVRTVAQQGARAAARDFRDGKSGGESEEAAAEVHTEAPRDSAAEREGWSEDGEGAYEDEDLMERRSMAARLQQAPDNRRRRRAIGYGVLAAAALLTLSLLARSYRRQRGPPSVAESDLSADNDGKGGGSRGPEMSSSSSTEKVTVL